MKAARPRRHHGHRARVVSRALVAPGVRRGARPRLGPRRCAARARAATRGVLAFVNYWLVRDEVHVLNVATHPEARRQGHAARLLEHVHRVRPSRALPLRDARGAPLQPAAPSASTASTASAPSASAPTTTSRTTRTRSSCCSSWSRRRRLSRATAQTSSRSHSWAGVAVVAGVPERLNAMPGNGSGGCCMTSRRWRARRRAPRARAA